MSGFTFTVRASGTNNNGEAWHYSKAWAAFDQALGDFLRILHDLDPPAFPEVESISLDVAL